MSDDNARGTLADYLVTFAPWLGYIALTELADSWRLGFLLGLGISAGTVAWRTRQGDSRFMDIGTLAYCAAMTGVSQIFPHSPLRPYNVPLSLFAVGILSLVSLGIRSPFTYRIAREKVPSWVLKDAGHHAKLFHAHVIATSSWAVTQTVAGALGAALIGARLVPMAIAAQVIGTVVPVGITRYQHERFMRAAWPPAEQSVLAQHGAASPENEAGGQHRVSPSGGMNLNAGSRVVTGAQAADGEVFP